MKYKQGNYIQLSREIFAEQYKGMSDAAKWFYCYLSELEHRLTDKDKDWFYKSDQDIADALNWSISKVQRSKKELVDNGFIKISKTRAEKYTKHITAYMIVK